MAIRQPANAHFHLASVLLLRDLGQSIGDIVTQIRSNPLQTADGDGLFFDPATAAHRFTGPIADATQYRRENVANPVHHIGVRKSALRDHPITFGSSHKGERL